MLSSKIGRKLDTPAHYIICLIFRGKVTPSTFTFLGLLLNVGAAVIFVTGDLRWGGVLILIAGTFDILDGAAARTLGKVSQFGGFLDSVVDRYSDMFLLIGLILRYSLRGDIPLVALTLVVSLGTVLVPYTRARAENFIPHCKVGLMERPERIILLAAGAIFSLMTAALWLLAILTHLTVIQRIYFTWKEAKRCEVEQLKIVDRTDIMDKEFIER
jgi:CDP-diacylglycerol--glycerol-3-phosphate 3-phosphatidyltransferase